MIVTFNSVVSYANSMEDPFYILTMASFHTLTNEVCIGYSWTVLSKISFEFEREQ
jgi:hypothetical protein